MVAPAKLNGSRRSTPARSSGPSVDVERVKQEKRTRFNPLRGLTPDKLVRQLENFDAGYLRDFALTAAKMIDRDGTLKSVVPKTKQAVARYGFEILTVDFDEKNAELTKLASEQKAELEFFYNNLTATNALDQDQRGGFQLLVRQMMEAHGMKYAVHEIEWKRRSDFRESGRDRYTATFWFVPLQFFEATLGRLRFIEQPLGIEGVDMPEGQWLVTVGEGVMIACAVAYMFKHLPLKDWLAYCDKFGFPGVLGKTSAGKGSPEWNNMKAAVRGFVNDWSAVVNEGEAIELVEAAGGNKLPFEELVDRMDRAMTRLWRGADLGTMSREKQTTGVTAQTDETEIIEQDLAAWISETLNTKVDRPVLEYAFGAGVPSLAYVKVLTAQRIDVAQEIKINDHLINHGAQLSLQTEMERFGRSEAKPTEAVMTPPAAPEPGDQKSAANAIRVQKTAQLIKTAAQQVGEARLADFSPLLSRLFQISQITNEVAMKTAAKNLRLQLPEYLRALNAKPAEAEVLAQTLTAAFFNGIDDAARDREVRRVMEEAGDQLATNSILGGHWVTHQGRHIFIKDGDSRSIEEIAKDEQPQVDLPGLEKKGGEIVAGLMDGEKMKESTPPRIPKASDDALRSLGLYLHKNVGVLDKGEKSLKTLVDREIKRRRSAGTWKSHAADEHFLEPL